MKVRTSRRPARGSILPGQAIDVFFRRVPERPRMPLFEGTLQDVDIFTNGSRRQEGSVASGVVGTIA